MINIDKLKPVPDCILNKIKKTDKKFYPFPEGIVRFYSYLTTMNKELVKITVAVKTVRDIFYYKQVAVHGLKSKTCFVKDIEYTYFGMSYTVGWYDLFGSNFPKNYETKSWCTSERQYYNPYSHLVNINYLKRFKQYKYSAYELFKGKCILDYLRIYEQYPQVELLLKQGISSYIAINKTLLKKVDKDKLFRRWLMENKDKVTDSRFSVKTLLAAYKNDIAIEKARHYEQAAAQLKDFYGGKTIIETIGNDTNRFIDYIEKYNITFPLYYDYACACKELQIDLSLDKHKYPKNFMAAHDLRIEQRNVQREILAEKEREERRLNFISIAKKYLNLEKSEKSGYMAIIAKTPDDLVNEGKALSHCVGGMLYNKRFAEEKTLIFFIRSTESPDTPLVTLEYCLESHKVLQCYAYHDTKPSDDILNFVNKKWLPYANRQIKKIAV